MRAQGLQWRDGAVQYHQPWTRERALREKAPMPERIDPLNTKNRPPVGRISCLPELGVRPIDGESLQGGWNSCFPASRGSMAPGNENQ